MVVCDSHNLQSGSKPFGLCGVANGIRADLHGCAWVKDANIGSMARVGLVCGARHGTCSNIGHIAMLVR